MAHLREGQLPKPRVVDVLAPGFVEAHKRVPEALLFMILQEVAQRAPRRCAAGACVAGSLGILSLCPRPKA